MLNKQMLGDSLESNGFTLYPIKVKDRKKKREALHLYIGENLGVIFILEDYSDKFLIMEFIEDLEGNMDYYIFTVGYDQEWEYTKKANGFPGRLSNETLEKILKDNSNLAFYVNKLKDKIVLNNTESKDVSLSNGKRYIKKAGEWRQAYSVEESENYFKSLVFTGPIGVHFLRHSDKGNQSIMKFLIYLATGGLYGMSWVDSLLMFAFGKLIVDKKKSSLSELRTPITDFFLTGRNKKSEGFVNNSIEIKSKWISVPKTKKNMVILLIGLVVSIILIFFSFYWTGLLMGVLNDLLVYLFESFTK